MEKLKLKLGVALAVMCIAGVLNATVRRPNPERFDEKWMEQHLPKTIDGWGFVQSQDNPEQSYRTSQQSYDLLKPFGIVGRVYMVEGRRIDAMVISGDNPDTFHDPHWCQNGEIVSSHEKFVPSKTRGPVPMFVASMDFDGRLGWMAWTYQGPRRMHPDLYSLQNDMFLMELMTGKLHVSTFYRVLALDQGSTKEEATGFLVRLLDETKTSAKGKL